MKYKNGPFTEQGTSKAQEKNVQGDHAEGPCAFMRLELMLTIGQVEAATFVHPVES